MLLGTMSHSMVCFLREDDKQTHMRESADNKAQAMAKLFNCINRYRPGKGKNFHSIQTKLHDEGARKSNRGGYYCPIVKEMAGDSLHAVIQWLEISED
jgi:hypothetical protein